MGPNENIVWDEATFLDFRFGTGIFLQNIKNPSSLFLASWLPTPPLILSPWSGHSSPFLGVLEHCSFLTHLTKLLNIRWLCPFCSTTHRCILKLSCPFPLYFWIYLVMKDSYEKICYDHTKFAKFISHIRWFHSDTI